MSDNWEPSQSNAGRVGLQSTFLHVVGREGVSSRGQSTWDFCWTEQHWNRFLSIFLFFHISLVSPLLHTFNILLPLLAAAPSNKTDAHWETGFNGKKKIAFRALKSVYAFGNSKEHRSSSIGKEYMCDPGITYHRSSSYVTRSTSSNLWKRLLSAHNVASGRCDSWKCAGRYKSPNQIFVH